MPKEKPNLAAALARTKEPQTLPPVTPAAALDEAKRVPGPANSSAAAKKASREGQSNISGWFDNPVKFTLDELRLKRQRELGRKVTLQELLGEAYNDLFKKYGLPEVAPSKQD